MNIVRLWSGITQLLRGHTKKATGTVSSTAMLVSGIENSLAPRGSKLLDGAAVPH